MLEFAQEPKKIDLNYYVTNHQCFSLVYIILCNLQNTNLPILSTKATPGNLITDYKKNIKEEGIKKDSKHFC